MRKERENLLCKHLLLYISKTNRGSVSGTFRLHSNLLNKADYDEKRGLLFHQIIPSPVNTFDCLQQFTGFYFGKLFYRLAQNITGILFGEHYIDAYAEGGLQGSSKTQIVLKSLLQTGTVRSNQGNI